MKPAWSLTSTGVLPHASANWRTVGDGLVRGGQGPDHLDQGHDRGRVEEVDAADLVGPAGLHGHLDDREGRGVGGQDGVVAGDPVELVEQLLLDGQVLDHRLDDQVARPFRAPRSEVPVTRPRAWSRSSSVFLPFSTCRLSDFSMAASGGVGRRLASGPQHHLEPADGGRLGDARAHDPRTDDSHACD